MSLVAPSFGYKRLLSILFSRQLARRVVQLTTAAENGTATLRTPVYLQHKMRKLRHKLLEKDRAALQRLGQMGNMRRPVVSCRRPERNWHWGQTTVGQPLASAGWTRSSRSHGDHFTVRRLADAPPPLEAEPFPDWLDPRLLAALQAMSITRPSPVQLECLEELAREKERPVLCLAEPGSGKTLAYLLPLLQDMLQQLQQMQPQALVVAPSRELADQLARVAHTLASACGLSACLLSRRVSHANVDKAQLLVSTPGVLRSTNLRRVRRLVLDEVDTLLDDSFRDSMTSIVDEVVRPDAQLVLVGAARPQKEALSELLGDQEGQLLRITSPQLHRLLPHVEHRFLRVRAAAKMAKLMELLQRRGQAQLVFANTNACCQWLGHLLRENGMDAACLHGEMSVQERQRQYARFAEGETDLLVCTDLGSRGLDTSRASRVINFDLPAHVPDYLHRAGRVGRLQGSPHATVISLVASAADAHLAQSIEIAAREARPVSAR
ncbi:probable ATP-dependent RNA helicase DDX28 isoform X1 [Dermacentor albipictus]|uniref:probable ATP-dependent RNA helicase DDX28 isoform X1 n=1 Tax=Dermacentor albipictus TaxID=60249 RepID=UPI0038FC5C74